MVRISIPPTLRRFCGDEDSIQVEPGTVGTAFDQLRVRFHGVHERLFNPDGHLRGSVLVFVNEEDIRFLREHETPLQSGDEVTIIPAFAGG
ncbi:MAG TPA: MoaD/ThiS family protein [Verrucomicrobiota bacterium]|nr:molybdopterin synthase sulfur carrier subunit [Verrucomicrobiales bacterium]HRI13539.1 MoaD/ThiS family protein [Verrucomicrobiota bacterium]